MSTTTAILPSELDPAANDRITAWSHAFHIETDVDAYLLRQLVAYSLLLDQTTTEERNLLDAEILNARHNWDASRRLDAAKLGSRLSRNPELNALKLRQTKQGCDWLLTRWHHLADCLKAGQTWTPKQHKLALDLTGAPADLRDPRNTIIDPSSLAAQEIATLTALRDGPLSDLDVHARECSLKGIPLDPTRPLQAARRRHATLTRLFQSARKLLRPKQAPELQRPTPTRPQSLPTPPPINSPSPSNHPQPRPFAPSSPTLNRHARRAAEAAARRA